MRDKKRKNYSNYSKSIAQIIDQDDKFLGNGFIYKGHLVATCSHIIAGYNKNYVFNLEFRISDNTFITSKGFALERFYHENKIDMAFIKLIDGNIPILEALPVMGEEDNLELYNLKAFGYFSRNSNIVGNWSKGKFLGLVTHYGDNYNFPLLQTRFPESQSGYSGSPAWDIDSGLVVGIITENYLPQEEMRNRDTTYLTAIELINNEFKRYTQSLERLKKKTQNDLEDGLTTTRSE